MNKLFYPRPLQPGDTVALAAPSSPVPAANLEAAVKSVKLLGLDPVVMPSCREHHGYMAGTDAQRASDLNEALSRKDIAGIFCLRGGFGAMRLLPLLDFNMIRQNPKPLIGYSDITALHTSINKLCGFVTFHGPMPNTDYSRLDDFTLESLEISAVHPQDVHEAAKPAGTGAAGALSDRLRHKLIRDSQRPLCSRYLLVLPMLPKAIRSSPVASLAEICLVAGTLGPPGDRYEERHPLFRRRGRAPLTGGPATLRPWPAGKFRDCAGILLGTFTDCEEPPHDDPSDSGVIADRTLTLQQIMRKSCPI